MMENELISLIVPVYNVEDYLRPCVDSLLGQTYENIELLLIDDGSTDSSGSICDELALKDRRIRVCHTENAGISAARACGLERSAGRLIVYVDSDDMAEPEMLYKMYRRMEQDGSDMAACNYLRADSQGRVLGCQARRPLKDALLTGTQALELLCSPEGGALVQLTGKLYSRSLLEALPVPGKVCCEDELLIHRILYRCNTVSLTEEGLYIYRLRPGSITDGIDDSYHMDAAAALMDRCGFLKGKGLCGLALYAAGGAVNLLFSARVKKENRPRERELLLSLRALVKTLRPMRLKIRQRLKLFLMPRCRFIYKAAKTLAGR